MKKSLLALATVASLASLTPVEAGVYNLKVVTDGNPDYSDLDSLVHSATSRWETDEEKMWALFYWSHIARRQTNPMGIHGKSETDPIRQFNDYGYTMCSTISGISCMIWQHMGYPVNYFDIGVHTVPEVFYGDKWHHYDNSLSVYYTLCDGKTVAGIKDIGLTLGCEASGGKEEKGHIALYHAMNGTSVDGFLEGGDTDRDLRHIGEDTFSPDVLKHRTYYNDGERGHRYILNLRDGEVYARHYQHLDKATPKPDAKGEPTGELGYYTPNGKLSDGTPRDPEAKNPRYRIRGNGVRTWTPQPAADGIYKVEGANVITMLKISADSASNIAISTTNGISWTDVHNSGAGKVDLKLIDQVNGAYEVLVKAPDAKNIKFETITQINSKTQPQLKLGANTVYVGAGPQEESIVVWPELQADRYKQWAKESVNIKTKEKHEGWNGVLGLENKDQPGYMIYKIDAPNYITKITQGARMYVRVPKAEVSFEHSFDDGQTWIKSYTFTDTEQPWDDIHNQVIKDIPAGVKSVLLKYNLKNASLYSIRMEVNHAVNESAVSPVEVTFNWSERQEDYSLVQRSHTQLVEKLPATYTINVGGADHPVVNSLIVNPKGARTESVKYGYSDGKDAGGSKFVGNWVAYGKNLALNKPYTAKAPPAENKWNAADPEGKVLTDGRVGSNYTGGKTYKEGPLWNKGTDQEITVDLGQTQKAAAFRIHINGYKWQDALKGQVEDEVEVLVSNDGTSFTSAGKFDFRLRWKDLPVNFMWPDDEQLSAYNHVLSLAEPVDARYVKFAIKPGRMMVVSEVQVLDGIDRKPFDLKIALPADAGNATARAASK